MGRVGRGLSWSGASLYPISADWPVRNWTAPVAAYERRRLAHACTRDQASDYGRQRHRLPADGGADIGRGRGLTAKSPRSRLHGSPNGILST